jgi:hypothetical protein
MSEFDAYGEYKTDVSNLVNSDIGADIFFNSLNTGSRDVVTYISAIEDILKQLSEGKWDDYYFKIFPTTIQINNKYGDISTHSVVLIWENRILYLYDPNGVYNTEEYIDYGKYGEIQQSLGYEYDNTYFGSTDTFKDFIEQKYNIMFLVPTSLGPQFIFNIEEEDTIYIKEGGYCMFFNYMTIEYILNNIDTIKFTQIYNQITIYPFNSIFNEPAEIHEAKNGKATTDTFEGKTVEIIKKVFGKKGGYKAQKRKPRKNKTRKTRKNKTRKTRKNKTLKPRKNKNYSSKQ